MLGYWTGLVGLGTLQSWRIGWNSGRYEKPNRMRACKQMHVYYNRSSGSECFRERRIAILDTMHEATG